MRLLLGEFEVREVTEKVAEIAVELRRDRPGFKLPDALIYATAIANGAVLVTRNTRDFRPDDPRVRVPYRL